MSTDGPAPLRELRRRLHGAPELAGSEAATAELMAAFLEAQGPDALLDGLGGNGLAARFDGAAPGPTVLLRAELDALPIHEASSLPHRSQRPGVAHLCGHDGHMAILAGVAVRLGTARPARGRVWLLLQPSEETGEGARRVTADPRFAGIDPEWAFAIHNLPGHPLGTVLLRDGAFACGSVGLVARLHGTTAHAAHPELARSPAAAVARLIPHLSGLADPAALPHPGFALSTVIHAQVGDMAFGTTPGEAVVCATLRADDEEVLGRLREAAVAAVSEEAARDDLGWETSWVEPFPVTVNDPEAVAAVRLAASGLGLRCEELPRPLRWSEDFGELARGRRGALIGLGAGEAHAPLHAPTYDFPDALLETGVDLFRGVLDHVLGGGGRSQPQ